MISECQFLFGFPWVGLPVPMSFVCVCPPVSISKTKCQGLTVPNSDCWTSTGATLIALCCKQPGTWKKSAYHWFRPASALWNRQVLEGSFTNLVLGEGLLQTATRGSPPKQKRTEVRWLIRFYPQLYVLYNCLGAWTILHMLYELYVQDLTGKQSKG